MDEKDWRILQTVYQERNITKAAERLYISQPALTYRIKQLEEEFNVRILLRGKRGVEFTPEGNHLVLYSNKMLADLRKTKEHLENMDTKIRGTLRLGVASIFARYELPEILSAFLKEYPDVEIILKTGWSADMHNLLQKEETHVGIIRGNYHWPGKKYLLNEEKLFVVSKDKINLENLPELSRINYKTDLTLKGMTDSWWQETFDTPPKYTMEVDRIDTCIEMVLHGLGFAVVPEISLKGYHQLHRIEVSSENNSEFSRKTWLIFNENSLELSIVKAFVDFILKRETNE
ncbi:LysR family transcriptional regulator [Neobacillus mesonae]|uniref:LysR family transcriptional regulator n=1 Tax=Neobacillus mesonae TaxID=1193713 RepID=UPI0025737A04|nr:LysR family transcriptional regulator [Neobacillus mesonae]